MRRRQAGAKARARSGRGSRYSDDEWEDSEDVHEVNLDTLEEGSNRNLKPILIGVLVAALVAVVGALAYQYMGDSEVADTPIPNSETKKAVD
jgi:predicted outer membrane lipoprotein